MKIREPSENDLIYSQETSPRPLYAPLNCIIHEIFFRALFSSIVNRECLIRAINDSAQDYLSVADTIGVNRSTARGIVRRHLQEGQIAERPRGGPNHRKVDDEMKQCIEEILNENPVLTLDGINRLLQERLPDKPRIHSRTVGKVSNGMLYTFKLVRRCPAERNRPDVIQSRRDYAAWFLGEAIQRQIRF